MNLDLRKCHIDNNFYRVSNKVAGRLAREGPNGKLPRHGYECRVYVNGCPCWLSRTVVNGKPVWAVHGVYLTSIHLVPGMGEKL